MFMRGASTRSQNYDVRHEIQCLQRARTSPRRRNLDCSPMTRLAGEPDSWIRTPGNQTAWRAYNLEDSIFRREGSGPAMSRIGRGGGSWLGHLSDESHDIGCGSALWPLFKYLRLESELSYLASPDLKVALRSVGLSERNHARTQA
jgi:hypothetical protein